MRSSSGGVGNVDGIDPVIVEKDPGIGQRRGAYLGRERLDPLPRAAGDAGDFHIRHGRICPGMGPAHVPGSQYADAHGVTLYRCAVIVPVLNPSQCILPR